MFCVNLDCGKPPFMFLKARIRSCPFQNFFGLITKNVVDEWIDLLVEINFLKATEETTCKVSIAYSPFLDGPNSAFWFFSYRMLEEIFSEGMGQPMVEANIGLEMVMNFRPLDPIENGINMSLPLV